MRGRLTYDFFVLVIMDEVRSDAESLQSSDPLIQEVYLLSSVKCEIQEDVESEDHMDTVLSDSVQEKSPVSENDIEGECGNMTTVRSEGDEKTSAEEQNLTAQQTVTRGQL
ncbi:uncharacterized protein [Periplaneta americana]|uniref:uncharacterized protein isoform X9 n=1 Tax=Periplaneta americana TaxID=6978 RepID=UPI0037E94DC5